MCAYIINLVRRITCAGALTHDCEMMMMIARACALFSLPQKVVLEQSAAADAYSDFLRIDAHECVVWLKKTPVVMIESV